jgi:flagellar protein FlaG
VASVSVSSLILFIAAMVIAAGVAGTMMTSVQSVSDAFGERSDDLARDIETEVTIISDPGSGAVYDADTETITVLLKNTGDRSLPARASAVDVLVDGQYVSADATRLTVVDDSDWRPGAVVRLEVDRSLASGSHRLAVNVNDDREVLRFYT